MQEAKRLTFPTTVLVSPEFKKQGPRSAANTLYF